MTIFEASQNPDNSDRTVVVEPEDIESLTSELASVTDNSGISILPNDLGDTVSAVETLLRLICSLICYPLCKQTINYLD